MRKSSVGFISASGKIMSLQQEVRRNLTQQLPRSVEKTILLRELLPCSLAAKTAAGPMIWCCESSSSHESSSPKVVVFRRHR